jgi:ubiquinone/menaquinone biosynthesis C-methylase UbiE
MQAYPLERTDRERDRLERQARVLRPFTERLLRAAGAGTGSSILDLGTGAGDVALLAADIAGPSGRVVSLDQDAGNLERAGARIASAGITNLTFVQGDISDPPLDDFDVAIGRYVLMYQPDPVAVVRAIARAIRPGGSVAFHEISLYEGMRDDSWPPETRKFDETMSRLSPSHRRRVQNSMAPRLPSIFAEAGLDVSDWGFEMAGPLVNAADAIVLGVDLMRTFEPLAVADGAVPAGAIDWDEQERLWREVPPHAALTLPASVLGWARKRA